jgi:hypothetical protein
MHVEEVHRVRRPVAIEDAFLGKSATILAQVSKLPLPVIERMTRAYYGENLGPALLQPVIDASAKYGVIPKPFPARELLNG